MSFISTSLIRPDRGQRFVQCISPESFTILTGRAFPQAGQASFAACLGVFCSITLEI